MNAHGISYANSPLWQALAAYHPSALLVTNGLRICSGVLAFVIIWFWSSAVWRCLRMRPLDGDASKAGWVPLAIAVLGFEVRWFLHAVSALNQARMLVVAHGGMTFALGFAIYVHGRDKGALRLRTALALYLAMLAICIGASAFLR